MQTINKIANWLVFSSKNSAKISLTVKSAFAGIAVLAGLFQFPLETLTNLQDATIGVINAFFLLVSALGVLIGSFRKVSTTLGGTNAVLNDPQL